MDFYQTFFISSNAPKFLIIFTYWPLIFPLAPFTNLLHTLAQINRISFSFSC